jgi:hypothetical protein
MDHGEWAIARPRKVEDMARDNNAFAKRQRETRKKRKAEDKKARRLRRKQPASGNSEPDGNEQPAGEQEADP